MTNRDTAPAGTPHTGAGVRAAVGSLATNAIIALIGLATGTLAARTLGPQGRGELASIQTVPLMLAALSFAGMPSALTYFCAKDRASARSLYASALTIALLACVPFAALGWLLLPTLLKQNAPTVLSTARLYLAFLPLQVIASLPFNVLLGIGQTAAWNILRLLPSLAWLAVLVSGSTLGLTSATFFARGYLACYCAIVPISTWLMIRRAPQGTPYPSRARIGALLRFGAPGALGSIPFLINMRLDQVAMTAVLPASQLGIYVAAVSWGNILGPASGALAPVLLPQIARASIDDDHRRATAAHVARLAILLVTGAVLIVELFTPLAIPMLFGPAFAAAVRPAAILVLAGGFAGLNLLLEETLKGLGAPRWALIDQLASVPVTITILWLLLRDYGPTGAAVASLLAYASSTAVLLFGLKRETGRTFGELCIPSRSDASRLPAQILSAFRKGSAA